MNEQQRPPLFGTLEQAEEQIYKALIKLTELYNYTLEALETTPRSKTGKHIKGLVEDAGRRLVFARNSITEARKNKEQEP